jgi:hypothetical protein
MRSSEDSYLCLAEQLWDKLGALPLRSGEWIAVRCA